MARRLLAIVGTLLLALVGASPADAAPTAPEQETTALTVMTFNIWLGGLQVDFRQVSAAIDAAGADVVGVQEPGGNLARLARDMGWNYVDEGLQIISRYPIVEPGGAANYVFVEVTPGKVVAVSNVHLRPYPYGPYDLRDGASLSTVLANEQQYHMNEMASRFSSLPALAAAGVPVFLTGDFNVPSHLDWTSATPAATPRAFDRAVAWPVSTRLAGLGFRDSFRETHPDPVTKPGYTWTPGYPAPTVTADEVHDRIDFVYAAGPSTTTGSRVVGEPSPPSPLPGDFGGPPADVVVNPWPSDHRAVASTFQVTPIPPPPPGPAPALTTSKARYCRGEAVVVSFTGAPGGPLDWVGIYDADDVPNGNPGAYRWSYVSGQTSGA